MAPNTHSSGCSPLELQTDDRRASPNLNSPPSDSATDDRSPGESAGPLCLTMTDDQVKQSALCEVQQLLEQALRCPMSSPCRKLLLRAELRACFLVLHGGISHLHSQEWRRIHYRSLFLQSLINQDAVPRW